MKKLLALVLALVMTLSLCTISNAAYSDAKDVDYKEAVDVMSMVGVFEGADGKFSPKANLTREQAAKLIAYLDLGKSVAEALPATKVFNDVEASRWSSKYVAYCADAGYINGVGEGKFNPAGELTGYAFGKMILCVLGYKADVEGMTGSAWEIAVAKLMEKNKIAKDVDTSASAVLTREAAAQYCFNALKADTYFYATGDIKVEGNGMTVTVGGSAAQTTHTTLNKKLYTGTKTLTCSSTPDKKYDTEDDFGRPAYTWTYGKGASKKTVDVVDKAVATFTAATKADAVATALKGYKTANDKKINNIDKYTATTIETAAKLTTATAEYTTTGTTETLAKAIADLTKNGKLVEIFADSDSKLTKVVEVSFTNDQVEKVSTDKKTGDVTYKLKTAGSFVDYADEDKDDQIVFVTAPAKDDYVTVYKISSSLAYVYATEKVEGAISYVKGDDKVTIAGTTYEANEKYEGDFALTTKTATVYVDQYGFVSAYKGPSTSGDKSVVVTKKYQTIEDGELINMFKGVTSNGETMESKWKTNTPVVGTVYTYGDADDDGFRVLTAVTFDPGTVNTGAIDNDKVVYVGNAALSTSTKKVVVKDADPDVYGFFTGDVKVIFVDNGKATVAEGVQKVASGSEQFAVLKKSSGDDTYYIDTLYVIGAPVASSTTSDDIVFVAADSTSSIMKTVDGKDKTYYVYTAYLNGEKVDDFYATTDITTVKGFYTVDIQDASGAYVLAGNVYNSSNDSETLAVTAELTIAQNNKVNAQNILAQSASTDYVLTDAVIVDTTSNDNNISSISDLNDAIAAGNVKAFLVLNEKTMAVAYIYVTEYTAF